MRKTICETTLPLRTSILPENNTPSIHNCKLIELPTITSRNGSISPIHGNRDIPFDIKRVFYTYGIPVGESRGGHAHKNLHQFVICANGSFDVSLDDGINKEIVSLKRPNQGLYVPPNIWDSEFNFSLGAVCLVLASDFYMQSDYIREYDEYLRHIKTL